MSQLIIHYGSLEDAQKKAEKAGDKLADYAEKAQSKIASKISSYSGQRTGNISSAQDYINNKIKQLQNKSGAFLQYANDVGVFIEEAKETDKAVKGRINTLSGNFKSDYGIKDNIITNVFNYLSDKLNETALGRFFKDMAQVVAKTIVSLKDCIVEWYKYEGGKYIIDAVFAVGAAVLAVCAIVAAVVIEAPLIVIIAGVIVGAVALANALTDFRNSLVAYGKEKQGDPAWAKRYGDLDTMTDTIRAKSNDISAHIFASVVDATELAAQVVLIVYAGGKALKNLKGIGGHIKSYGGFKEYFKYQYKANSQGLAVVKNALFGTSGEKARAKELLKLYGSGKIADLKNMAGLYMNPRNWFTNDIQRANLQGYSVFLESAGIQQISQIYFKDNWGLKGILNGTDTSFTNFAVTINRIDKLVKSVKGLSGGNLWRAGGISYITTLKGELKNYQISILDITKITDRIEKQMKKITELFSNMSNMRTIQQNWNF